MARPRCDPFDAAAIIATLADGKTTPLLAYEDYACSAARPYARSTFELILRQHQRSPQLGDRVQSISTRLGDRVHPPLDTTLASQVEADTASAAYWAARL